MMKKYIYSRTNTKMRIIWSSSKLHYISLGLSYRSYPSWAYIFHLKKLLTLYFTLHIVLTSYSWCSWSSILCLMDWLVNPSIYISFFYYTLPERLARSSDETKNFSDMKIWSVNSAQQFKEKEEKFWISINFKNRKNKSDESENFWLQGKDHQSFVYVLEYTP